MKFKVLDRVVSTLAVIVLMAVIFSFSSQTAGTSNSTSGGFIESLARWFYPKFDSLSEFRQDEIVATWQFFVRKTAHFCIFALLGFLSANAVRSYGVKGTWKYVLPLGVSVIYAASDEIHQNFVPGRSGQIKDVLLDSAGAAAGIVFFFLVLWLFGKIFKRSTTAK